MKNNYTFIRSVLLAILCGFTISANAATTTSSKTAKATDVFEGNLVTKEGAWCWFADPRALHYENTSGTINSTYISYIDVHGGIKATQHNFLTGKNNEVLIRSYFQPDDHNVPAFLILPDERVMIFYSRHTDEACFYYRISKKPGDITNLGEEKKIVTANNTTYPNPFILSDDPTHIYLGWRGINWHPTIAKLSLPDANDNVTVEAGPYQVVQSTGARPYAKYYSNGKDKIYLTYTTGHPDNEYPNWVYLNYIDINTFQLKDITGTVLSTVPSGVHNVNKTTYNSTYPAAVVDAPTDQRDWAWQTAIDKDGLPVVAMVQISNDKLTHNYYYFKWTGTAWRKTFLAYGGAKFHQTAGLELCYSGGLAIDDDNPNIVYCSVPTSGTSGTVYEIKKFVIGTDGTVTSSEMVTTNSTLNNSRPYVIQNSGKSQLRLGWMHGNYYDWIVSSTNPKGYPTEIRTDWSLPADNIDLTNGLQTDEAFTGTVTGTATISNGVLVSTTTTSATISASSSSAFSLSLTPYIYEGAYKGTILKMGNLTYGLNGTTVKPYVQIGSTTYPSMNLLGTSDVWQTTARGTGGLWYDPTKLKYFNLTLTYENGILRVYRNGLIDQVVEVAGLTLSDITLGGFVGWIEDCKVFNRALNQGEVKKLTETSIAYSLPTTLTTGAELASLSVPANVYTDIVLPAKTAAGNTVTWATNNAAVLAATGLVTFPSVATPVTLTATVSGQSATFNVTVYPRNISNNKVIDYRFEAADVYTTNSIKYLTDKSGKGNDATIYGSAAINGTLDLTANTAAGFTTNGYAMAPTGILNNLRSCTFLAKVKASSLTSAPRIFDFGSASSNSFLLRASAFTAGLKYNGGSTTLINSSTSLTAGTEAKVAVTFDAKTKTTKIYHNGAETASATTIAYEPYQLTTIGANTRNYIGRTQWWDSSVASSNVDLVGTIDDFQVYDIVLTATEIAQAQSGNSTDIHDLSYRPVTVSQNPVAKNTAIILHCDLPANNLQDLKAELFNPMGQLIYSSYYHSSEITLPAATTSGIYFARLTTTTNNVYTAKVVVR